MKLYIPLFVILLSSLSLYAQDSSTPVSEEKKFPISNESEVGIVVSDGNTKAETYLIKQKNEYKKNSYTVKGFGDYNKTETRDNTTSTTAFSEKWLLGTRFEYDITKEKLGTFLGQSVSSNKTAGEDRRYDSDVGGKYVLIKKETYYNFIELGYRYTKIFLTTSGDSESHYIRLYNEAEKKWTPTFSNKLWLEYLPNIKDSDDYEFNGELSLQATLTTLLSLKTAYLVKYKNEPSAGTEYYTDTLFTTSLIAKF